MFLNRLNNEEKKAFLSLAHHMARVDLNFMDEQKQIISQYCLEMGIDDIEYDESKFDLVKVLKTFTNSKSQKIVLLEIMALVYADNILHETEQEIIDIMCKEFNINSNLANVFGEWSKAIMALYIQGENLIEL